MPEFLTSVSFWVAVVSLAVAVLSVVAPITKTKVDDKVLSIIKDKIQPAVTRLAEAKAETKAAEVAETKAKAVVGEMVETALGPPPTAG